MAIELRSLMVNEADLIERLFQETYNREQGVDYWKWCFDNPFGYINSGVFEGNRLIGYYAAQFTENSAFMQSAMVHPNYRKKGIYLKIAFDLYDRISTNRSFLYIYSNEMIRQIHLKKEGVIELYQVKEYRIPIVKSPEITLRNNEFFIDDYMIWRYRNHPLNSYVIEERGVFSSFEDRIQILDYSDNESSILEKAIEVANYLGYWDNKKYISCWSEMELDYPYILLPLWKQYKIFNDNITIEDIKTIDENKMGLSDVY